MPSSKDSIDMLRQHTTARETRSSNASVHIGNLDNQLSPSRNTPYVGRDVDPPHNHTKRQNRTTGDRNTLEDSTDGDETEGGDTGTEGEADEDEEESGAIEPEEVAPSAKTVKINSFRTGRKVYDPVPCKISSGTKRAWSTSSDEVENTRGPKKATKFSKRDFAVAIPSDDEDYDGVDLISDSDEEEPTLEKFEEQMIIESEEENVEDYVPRFMPGASPSASFTGWQDFALDEGLFLSDVPFFQEQTEHADPQAFANAMDIFSEISLGSHRSSPSPPPPRRVRFADDVLRGSDGMLSPASSANNDIFPDLFMPQDTLDPTFRLLIENDNCDDVQSLTDGERSYWDFEHNDDFDLEKCGLQDSSSECGSSSGYESGCLGYSVIPTRSADNMHVADLGETTDEEVIPPKTVNRPQSLLRIHSATTIRDVSTPKPTSTPTRRPASTMSTPASRRRHGPSLKTWIVDPHKPIAIIDDTGKTMLIFDAPSSVRKRRAALINSLASSTAVSPQTSFAALAGPVIEDSEIERSDPLSQEQSGTILRSPADVTMMPELLHGSSSMDPIISAEVIGPAEAFYPFTSIDANGAITSNDDEDNDLSPVNTLNLQEFIDFGDDLSESDAMETEDSDPTLLAASLFTTPSKTAKTITQPSSAENLLQHFARRGVVSSFRRNQTHHQSLLRRPHLNTAAGTAYGIKGGRHHAASSPLSPLRKHKASRSLSSATGPFKGAFTAKGALAAKSKVAKRIHIRSKSAII